MLVARGESAYRLTMWTKLSDGLVNPRAIAPLGGGGVLCAGERSAVSRDEGRTWATLELPQAEDASPSHVVGRDGAYTSDDGWRSFHKTLERSLGILCERSGNAWAAGGSALYRFTEGEWVKLSTGSRKRIGAIAYGHEALLLSVGKQTVLRSTDLGETWTQHTLGMRSNEWLTRIWVLEQGFIGVTNARPFWFWTSPDGIRWTQLDVDVPSHWTGTAAGDQLYLAGAGTMTVVEHMGGRIEPVRSPGEIRVLAYGPDDLDDNRLWAASRRSLWIGR